MPKAITNIKTGEVFIEAGEEVGDKLDDDTIAALQEEGAIETDDVTYDDVYPEEPDDEEADTEV